MEIFVQMLTFITFSFLRSKKMRAAILSKHKGRLDIVELPIPEPDSHQILVQIKASG